MHYATSSAPPVLQSKVGKREMVICECCVGVITGLGSNRAVLDERLLFICERQGRPCEVCRYKHQFYATPMEIG